MKKLFTLFLIIFALSVFCLPLFAEESKTEVSEEKIVYISPNDDGVQDNLEVPIKISDKRYISEWAFVITDEQGNTVRTIGNKDARPETPKSVVRSIFSKNFFKTIKQLFSPKTGVQIPSVVMWNGTLDNGLKAEDGMYYYYLSAKDDNYNESRTQSYKVVVDNTPPELDLVQPSEGAKIFGAGNKASIKFEQTGSKEDLWQGTVTDSKGNSVRVYEWKNSEPLTIEWDGKNNVGVSVPEGVYSYSIEAVDRAGNKSESAVVSNIIYDAIPRSVNMIVKGSPFSPNDDGKRDTVTIQPNMPNAQGLVSWEISVNNADAKAVRTYTGTTTPPADIIFDGRNDTGITLVDGDYQVKFLAMFNNGQEALIYRNITIDNTAPAISVMTDGNTFGGAGKPAITISQEGSSEKLWSAQIINAKGDVIKTWSFAGVPNSSIEWNGLNDKGQLVDDGYYTYTIVATDAAGNLGLAQTQAFQFDTSKTEILLTASSKAFSPNGDKISESVTYTPVTKSTSGIKSYVLKIADENGNAVRTFSANKSLPASFVWDGKDDSGSKAKDGVYSAELSIEAVNGNSTSVAAAPVILDTIAPSVNAEVPYLTFSPNNDGSKDVLPVLLTNSTSETQWKASFRGKDNKSVAEFTWKGEAASFDWKGTDETGNIVPDGTYSFVISSTDEAGNSLEKVLPGIVVDNRSVKTYVTADYNAFSPNGDKYKDTQKFSIMTTPKDGIADWTFAILGSDGKAVRSWSSKDTKDLPASITWDGFDDGGKIAEGTFTGRLDLEYSKGDKVLVSSSDFISTVTPPQLTVQTSPDYFSPDNDGEADDLFIKLSGKDTVPFQKWSFDIRDPNNKLFWSTSGKKAITERIIWDGRGKTGELVQSASDYEYTFTVTDEVGLTSTVKGVIPVDVLVIRMGDVLKMQVPSIIFRSDKADFGITGEKDSSGAKIAKGITAEQKANNERVLKRIAEILNKFQDYRVTIEGHANNISGTEEEETSTVVNGQANIPLEPLSKERADYVKSRLVKYGVSSSRLSTVGRGGRQPVVSRTDRDNWWKNRRVEFILEK